MKFQGNIITKVIALVILGGLGALGVGLTSFVLPSPYHYVGVLMPVVVVYLLGFLASKNDIKP